VPLCRAEVACTIGHDPARRRLIYNELQTVQQEEAEAAEDGKTGLRELSDWTRIPVDGMRRGACRDY